MTVPPLPDVPCVRIRCQWRTETGLGAGSRFYFSYSGSAPSGADCNTLASHVSLDWEAELTPLSPAQWVLEEIDVVDLATRAGASGTWNGTIAGSRAGQALPNQVCANIEFDIARRYRGGKPRIYLPLGVQGDLADERSWGGSFITAMNTGVAGFFNGIAGESIGSMGTLKHINLSYFSGFTNHTNTSGRARAVPTYRGTAQHDDVTGYAAKAVLGSQRRRRSSLT